MLLASIKGSIQYGGSCAFLPTIEVGQRRDDFPIPDQNVSFDFFMEYDERTWLAINDAVRRTGAQLLFDGTPVVFGRIGDTSVASTMVPGDFTTIEFHSIGPLWSMPTVEVVPGPYDPCPSVPTIQPGAGRSPLAWGNKRVVLYFLFSNRVEGREVRVFQGWTFQKSNQADVGIQGSFTAVDDSLLYSKIPLCYQLQPFSGKHRGDIVRDIAALQGIDPASVNVPLGKIVNKPVLLSNGSLIPFIAELGLVENWFPYFDENGILTVKRIEMKNKADWILDASKGDYVYDSIQETIPQNPPSTYYITASTPVQNGGPDGVSEESTLQTTETLQELYAPQTVKVRPSGGASHLYADGSYRSLVSQQLMTVAIAKTFATKRNGIPVRNRTERSQFYNPAGRDPNFDYLPPSTSYDHAYGNKTFHRDEVEGLVLFSEDDNQTVVDDYGTVQQTLQIQRGWYSPQHAMHFFTAGTHTEPVSSASAFMYPGSIFRADRFEQYIETQRIETSYTYGEDGALSRTLRRTKKWSSPQSRCDIVAQYPDPPPIPGPVPPPPIITPYNPPPPPVQPPVAPPVTPPKPVPPVKTVWKPTISGPRKVGLRFFFDIDFSSAPSLGTVVGTWTMQPFLEVHGDGSGAGTLFKWTVGDGPALMTDTPQTFGDNLPKKGTIHFDLTTNTSGYVGAGSNTQMDFGGSKRPPGFTFARITITATVPSGPQAGQVQSYDFTFDPWQGFAQTGTGGPPPLIAPLPPLAVPPSCPVLYKDANGNVAGGLIILIDGVDKDYIGFTVGVPFFAQLSVTNGTPPYTWILLDPGKYGQFPIGITLNPSTGVISGTPTGWLGIPSRGVVVRVTDAHGCVGYH